jgi:Lhr-like helicase
LLAHNLQAFHKLYHAAVHSFMTRHASKLGCALLAPQAFHTLYHTDEAVLLGAPTGSGKTISSELTMLRLFTAHPDQKVRSCFECLGVHA